MALSTSEGSKPRLPSAAAIDVARAMETKFTYFSNSSEVRSRFASRNGHHFASIASIFAGPNSRCASESGSLWGFPCFSADAPLFAVDRLPSANASPSAITTTRKVVVVTMVAGPYEKLKRGGLR